MNELEWKLEKYGGCKGGYSLDNKYRNFITALQIKDLIEIKKEIERVLKTP